VYLNCLYDCKETDVTIYLPDDADMQILNGTDTGRILPRDKSCEDIA
jgi:hypothetical protein